MIRPAAPYIIASIGEDSPVSEVVLIEVLATTPADFDTEKWTDASATFTSLRSKMFSPMSPQPVLLAQM
jgi:hypothetical protein